MSNELMIPPAVSTAVQPKPTKAEIIEALTIRKHAQLTEQAAKDDLACKAQRALLNDAIVEHLTSKTAAFIDRDAVYVRGYNGRTTISVTLQSDNPPAHILKLVQERDRLEKARVWAPPFNVLRKRMRESLSNATPKSERISTLLNDAKSSKQLDAMLSALFGKQPASIAV